MSLSNPPNDRELMRLLHGELDAERRLELRRELERDPHLAERYHRLAAIWERLELGAPAAVPPGFAARVLAAARAEQPGSEVSWALAPLWARAGAALALAAGIWLGMSVGQPEPGVEVAAAVSEESIYEVYGEPQSLAESYWLVLEEDDVGAAENGESLR